VRRFTKIGRKNRRLGEKVGFSFQILKRENSTIQPPRSKESMEGVTGRKVSWSCEQPKLQHWNGKNYWSICTPGGLGKQTLSKQLQYRGKVTLKEEIVKKRRHNPSKKGAGNCQWSKGPGSERPVTGPHKRKPGAPRGYRKKYGPLSVEKTHNTKGVRLLG